jgi:Ca2+-binding RTX toxin-like protein
MINDRNWREGAILPSDAHVRFWAVGGASKNLTSGDDTYTGQFVERVFGGKGDDTIDQGNANEVHGDQGNDILTATGVILAARLFGGVGDDRLAVPTGFGEAFGEAGNDLLISGAGGPGIVRFYGGPGSDSLSGSNNNDVLDSGDDGDSLFGAAGSDSLYGGASNDTLDGGSGADRMRGGIGNDTYVVDNGDDVVDEFVGAGIDRVVSAITFSLASTARVVGSIEDLTLSGATGISGTGNNLANVITGNNFANTLSGGIGNDTLNGGLGNDRLIGGVGIDRLTGAANNDIFVFNTAPNPATNRDIVTDFNHVNDVFHFENAVSRNSAQACTA